MKNKTSEIKGIAGKIIKRQLMKEKIEAGQLTRQQTADIIANMNAQMNAFNNALRNAFSEIQIENAVEPHSTSVFEIERRCRKCGCTEFSACLDEATGSACYWVEEDLCSACATPKQKAMSETKKLLSKLKKAIGVRKLIAGVQTP
jgi:cytochrome c2